MKRLILISIILIARISDIALSSTVSPAVDPSITMVEGMIDVDMVLNLKDIPVKSGEVVIVVPYLVSGKDSLELGSVGVFGHRRYIQYQRGLNGRVRIPEIIVKASDATSDFRFTTRINYQDWMDGATLNLKMNRYGCANCSKGQTVFVEGIDKWLSPHTRITADNLIYLRPEVDKEKLRDIEGSAKVDFPVNSIVLLEDFRDNFAELRDIRSSIDSVKENNDATIKNIYICGYASPEGNYANNERLAIGRTRAVADYVRRMYAFPAGVIETSSVAEDWDGLRQWVEKNNLENKDEFLTIINNTDLTPDERDREIYNRFPSEYATLLNTVYPGLRHTDYRINYSLRSYSDPVEILSVMKTRPGNLSLDELFIAARSLEPDSDDFREVFEVAVRLYPQDPIANLNAANTALLRSDLKSAKIYLEKAGDSGEVKYTRGVLAIMENDFGTAESLLKEARDAGIPQADEMLAELASRMEYERSRHAAVGIDTQKE